MGMALSRREREFLEAYRFFAGEEANPNIGDFVWQSIIDKIDKADVSPYEFLFFIIHKLYSFSPNLIRYKNLLNSDKVWETFTAYRENRPEQIKRLANLQRDELVTSLSVYKDPFFSFLEGGFSVSVPIKLDHALFLEKTQKLDITKIVDRYLEDCLYILIGNPEWLSVCPFLKDYCEKQGLI
jgi:hypothetical protein